MEDNSKVIIVGAGLVGTLCACILSRNGFHVDVYEKGEDIRTVQGAGGKSINLALSHRGLKALKLIDLDEEALKNAIPMRGRCLHLIAGNRKMVPYDVVHKRCIYSINRNCLNCILLARAERMPNVRLWFLHKLTSIDFGEGICTFRDLRTDKEIIRKSDLIVGADGAYSTVRSFMQRTPFFTYSQSFIDHGYVELKIDASFENVGRMEPNHLHIWPRKSFMLIGLPNNDDSWTLTLFMPFDRLDRLQRSKEIVKLFEEVFPDVLPLIGADKLKRDFLRRSNNSLVTIKCSRYHHGKALLIGDAAHAIVPFFGQGMNAGFEDCTLLNEILRSYKGDFDKILQTFSDARVKDAHAIADLAHYNYLDMRDLCTDRLQDIRKALDRILFRFSKNWVPLYVNVTFGDLNYAECSRRRQQQDTILKWCALLFLAGMALFFALVAY